MAFEERFKSLSSLRWFFFFFGLASISEGGALLAFAAFYWDLL